MKEIFKENISVLYTDTDSFIYEISNLSSEEIVSIFQMYSKQYFDFSNYSKTHCLFNDKNKKIPGFFKDEMAGKNIEEFVGLRSKMYAVKIGEKEMKTAKGVKKNVIENNFTFQSYKEILFSMKQREDDFRTISSHSHKVKTFHQKKISLSAFDDKRFLINEVESVPYGFSDEKTS